MWYADCLALQPMGGVLVRAISVVESTRKYRERRGLNNTASADPRAE